MKDWEAATPPPASPDSVPPPPARPDPVPPPAAIAAPRRRRGAIAVFAAGLTLGVVVAWLNTAGAQTPTPTPSTPSAPKVERHFFKHHGSGMGIHGEFVTPAPGGGYQTIATQRGEVTAVSASSITVRSEDGFSRTYSVDDDTLVNAGNDGIADVKNGDQVHVVAIVSGERARAVKIHDATQVRTLTERWRPRAG